MQELTTPRRRIIWRVMVTYYAVYKNPHTSTTITVHSLNPLPKKRTFRVAGGNRKFNRIQYKATKRKVIIMAKSAKNKGKGKTDIVDEELEDLEDLEDLDDLEDEELDEEETEEPDDEDEDDEDEDEDEESELAGLTVKELRAKAKEDGHTAAAIKGLKKDELIELIEEGVEEEDDEDEEDEDDEEEEEVVVKKSKKSGKTGTKEKPAKKKASRSARTDGKVGSQEIATAAGIDARKLRILLRKLKIERDSETGRYEWSSLNHPEVKKILRAVKGGAADEAAREGLDKLKNRKGSKERAAGKKTGAKRKRSKA